MSRRHAALTALFFLIACDTPAAPRARQLRVPGLNADVVTTRGNVFFDADGSLENTCNGDVVNLAGRVHQVFTEIDAGDTIHIVVHTNFAGVTGYGVPSGARYHVSDAERETTVVTMGTEFTFDDTAHLSVLLVSEGSEPNLIWDLTEVTRIDDTGVTVTDLKNSVRCAG